MRSHSGPWLPEPAQRLTTATPGAKLAQHPGERAAGAVSKQHLLRYLGRHRCP
jgi:hypothetical protein